MAYFPNGSDADYYFENAGPVDALTVPVEEEGGIIGTWRRESK